MKTAQTYNIFDIIFLGYKSDFKGKNNHLVVFISFVETRKQNIVFKVTQIYDIKKEKTLILQYLIKLRYYFNIKSS